MTTKEIVKRHYYNRKEVVITCDICSSEHISRADIKRCVVCGCDVCSRCAANIGHKPRLWRDCDSWYCEICWESGKYYIKNLEDAEEVFKAAIEEQLAIWRHDIGGRFGRCGRSV